MKNTIKRLELLPVFGLTIVVYYGIYWSRTVPRPDHLGFDRYLFADLCALLNAAVAVLLVSGRIAILKKKSELHALLMGSAFVLSFFFLLSYFAHHVLAGETIYPKQESGRGIYLFVLLTHILAAAVTFPMVLITALSAIKKDQHRHKKIARITFPIWLYVSVTGVMVYFMISPFYLR